MQTNNRTIIILLGLVLAIVLIAGSFSGGFLLGSAFGPSLSTAPTGEEPSEVTEGVNGSPDAATQELFKTFWESWDIIHQFYVNQPVDDQALMRGAIQGMIDSLEDPYSSYLTPDDYSDMVADLRGDYEGIGAMVNLEGEYLTISEPFPDSPAEEAGLLPGDTVIAIDGEDMTGIDPELARRRVLGPKGTIVVLTILREGVAEPFDVSITRARIIVPSVEAKMLDDGIAYLKLRQFGSNSGSDLRVELEKLMTENPKGLILDLRGNPGGYVSTCVQIASEFLPEGKVVLYEEDSEGNRAENLTVEGGLALDIPLVVLVNGQSASASEVLSGALRDYERATLVGEQTFGKGTVQTSMLLENGEEGAIKITIARWLTPNGLDIHGEGLTPDILVERTEEDFKADLDPQLDKAIELLK
jgi:carboxyl-terminal processing protease